MKKNKIDELIEQSGKTIKKYLEENNIKESSDNYWACNEGHVFKRSFLEITKDFKCPECEKAN